MNKIKDYLESVDRAQLKQDLYEIEEGFLDLPPYVRRAIVALNNRAAHGVCNEMRKHTIDYRNGIRATYSFCEEHNLKKGGVDKRMRCNGALGAGEARAILKIKENEI